MIEWFIYNLNLRIKMNGIGTIDGVMEARTRFITIFRV